jgi:hypothetical protein
LSGISEDPPLTPANGFMIPGVSRLTSATVPTQEASGYPSVARKSRSGGLRDIIAGNGFSGEVVRKYLQHLPSKTDPLTM